MILHSFVWCYCVTIALDTPHDALWVMVWNPLLFLDFPVSLVLQGILLLMPEQWIDAVDTLMVDMNMNIPYSYFWGFWLPVLLYGVLGAVWWYMLPSIARSIWQRKLKGPGSN